MNSISDLILNFENLAEKKPQSLSFKSQQQLLLCFSLADEIAQAADEFEAEAIVREKVSDMRLSGDLDAESLSRLRAKVNQVSLVRALFDKDIHTASFISNVASSSWLTKSYFCQAVYNNLAQNDQVDQKVKVDQINLAVSCASAGITVHHNGEASIDDIQSTVQIMEIFTVFDLFLGILDVREIKYSILKAQEKLETLSRAFAEGKVRNMSPFYAKHYPQAKVNFAKNKPFIEEYEK